MKTLLALLGLAAFAVPAVSDQVINTFDYRITNGIYLNGDIKSLVASDDYYLYIAPAESPVITRDLAPIVIEFNGMVSLKNPLGKMVFQFEASMTNGVQTIELYDYLNHEWVMVDKTNVSLKDQFRNIFVDTDRFISLKGMVSARATFYLEHRATPNFARIDLARWYGN